MPEHEGCVALLQRHADGDRRATREIADLGTSPSTSKDVVDALLDGLASQRSLDLLIEILYAAPFLRSEVYRVLLQQEDAEEAVQETMLAVARALPSFRSESSVRTWARRIARNRAIAVLRRRRDELGGSEDVAEGPGEVERFSSVLATHADVHQALSALPPEFGEVVRLRDIEHFSYEEIADRLDLNVNTVRSRLARGRARLAAILGP